MNVAPLGSIPGLRPAILGMDASGTRASAALFRPGGGPSHELAAAEGERAGTVLHALVAEVLEAEGLRVADLAAVACVRGPGSFTGLRVALATASGLACAGRVPGAGVETTRAVAAASGDEGVVVVVLDGGQGRVFVGVHAVSGGLASPVDGPRDASLDEALAMVRARAPGAHALLRGEPPRADELRAAGCAPFTAPLALAAARLACADGAAHDPLEALYARPVAIRPGGGST